MERLVVRSQGQVLFLNVADIDWIEAAGYYACVHVGGDTHVFRRPLSELQQDLGEDRFTRIHRSIIVNLERIRGLELQAGGEYEVLLRSKVRLRLSRRYRKRCRRAWAPRLPEWGFGVRPSPPGHGHIPQAADTPAAAIHSLYMPGR